MNTPLIPLTEANFSGFLSLLSDDSVVRSSLMYNNLFNFSYSCNKLLQAVRADRFVDNNRLFLFFTGEKDLAESSPSGITGLYDIDWIQGRGELILLTPGGCGKGFHDPLKRLLITAIEDWGLRRLSIKVFSENHKVIEVLKGFGFAVEGEAKDYVRIKKEFFDIKILGLKSNEFRYMKI